LLDHISIITSTLNSVDDSLTTLNDLVDLAKGSATKARQTLDTPAVITGNVKLLKERAINEISGCKGGDVLCLRYGEANRAESSQTVSKLSKLSDFGITIGENFSVKVGNDDWVDIPVTNQNMTLDSFMKEVVSTLGSDRVKYTIEDNKLTLETTDQTGIIFANRHYDISTKELIANDTSPSVAEKLGFDRQIYVTVDDDDTVETLMMEINKIDGVQAKLDKDGHLQISSQYGDDIIVTDFSGTTAKATGVDGMARDGLHVRRDEAKTYNDILDQIDELVKDSIFNGVNLLAGDDMRAVFFEQKQIRRALKKRGFVSDFSVDLCNRLFRVRCPDAFLLPAAHVDRIGERHHNVVQLHIRHQLVRTVQHRRIPVCLFLIVNVNLKCAVFFDVHTVRRLFD